MFMPNSPKNLKLLMNVSGGITNAARAKAGNKNQKPRHS
jgi:hypothetical protein